jgi:hypothetical protein
MRTEGGRGRTCVACLRIIVVSASSTKKVLWPAKILSEAPILVKILPGMGGREREVTWGRGKGQALLPINWSQRAGVCRDTTADLTHDCDETSLPEEGRFPSHVRATDKHDPWAIVSLIGRRHLRLAAAEVLLRAPAK